MLRLCLLSLALAAPLAGLSADTPPPAPAAAPAYVRPPAPGQLIDIGGRRLHVLCKGPTQGPTVLFEAGLSQYTANSTYGKAQDLIAAKVRVCVYDRAGLGWSDAAPGARTHQDMVEDLHTSYWRRYGGGYRAAGNFFNFARQMVDDMHRWYHDAGERFGGLGAECSGIHIHDSVVVFDKDRPYPPTHSRVSAVRRGA